MTNSRSGETKPVRVYLDTSDYSRMYRAERGSVEARTRDLLLEMLRSGIAETGLSYFTVLELLQEAGPDYREDRLQRARLLKLLCGTNAFAYPTDLRLGRAFNQDSMWVPRELIAGFDVEHLAQSFIARITSWPLFGRKQRRALATRSGLAAWLKENPDKLKLNMNEWSVPYGRSFIGRGHFRSYLLGELSVTQANRLLWCDIFDPEVFYESFFTEYGYSNPLGTQCPIIHSGLSNAIERLSTIIEDRSILLLDIKRLLKSGNLPRDVFKATKSMMKEVQKLPSWETMPSLQNTFGKDGARVMVQTLHAFHRERKKPKSSDGIDLAHALYLPHVTLWRGDAATSDLLCKHKVIFHERIVPSLQELPARIEIELQKRDTGGVIAINLGEI